MTKLERRQKAVVERLRKIHWWMVCEKGNLRDLGAPESVTEQMSNMICYVDQCTADIEDVIKQPAEKGDA